MKTRKRKQTYKQVSQYDKIIKENFKAVMPSLIDNVLNIKMVKQEDIPTKLQHTKEREADFLKVVTDENEMRFILHIEFQLVKDAKMRLRMLEYYLMLRMIYSDLRILQYVIFIGEVPNNFQNEIREERLYFSFDVVNIREVSYQHFLKSNIPEEIIFSILGDFGNENTDKVVETIIKSIKNNSKTQLQQQKCFQQLRILSNLRNFVPLIEKIMESIALYIKEENDPLFQKGLNLGVEQGVAKGIEQGVAKGIEQGIEQGVAKGIEQGIEQGVAKGIEQGIEQGVAKGIEQGIEISIKKMLTKGYTVSVIANLLDLNEEEVLHYLD